MGRTYIKFAVTDDGTLINRRTGAIYDKATVVKGNTVYSAETGRKIGNLGKGATKKERTRVQRATERVQKKERVAKNKVFVLQEIEPIPKRKDVRQSVAEDFDYWMYADEVTLTYDDIRDLNFFKRLDSMHEQGYLTDDEYKEILDLFESGEKSTAWDRITAMDKIYGYIQSDGLTAGVFAEDGI